MTISNEAIEAVREKARESGQYMSKAWAQRFLEAAAPHIRAQALQEVAELVADGEVPAYDSGEYADWLRARAESERAGIRHGNH